MKITKQIAYLLLTILCIGYSALPVFAQSQKSTPSQNPVATSSAVSETLQKVIDLIASQSAKRNDLEKKAILGTVREATTTKIMVDDIKNNERTIDIDELTKFGSGDNSKSFGISDIKPGENFVFIGKYNKETQRLLARFVLKVMNIPVQFSGVVLSKDIEEGTLIVADEENNQKTIDVSASTKTVVYTKIDGSIKSGFSKIVPGDRILITGFDDLKKEGVMNAGRIIHSTEIPLSKNLKETFEKEGITPTPTKILN